MFGYLCVNKPELKIREYDEYHSFYCGVCRELKRMFGLKGQISVSYDSAFLTMLLTGLYEPECQTINVRCMASPVKKKQCCINIYSVYSAEMNMFLNYHKCVDDWNDEGKYTRRVYSEMIKHRVNGIREKYQGKCRRIEEYLSMLSEMECSDSRDIDSTAGCFGHIMEEIFDYSDDEWKTSLKRIGFFLGKFIYLMDAYEDIENDISSGSYNVLKDRYIQLLADNDKEQNTVGAVREFENQCRGILSMMMAECSMEFERMPVIAYAGIIRNVLYSGVWCRFQDVTTRRIQKHGERK